MSEIKRIFDLQCSHSIVMRNSNAKERIAFLKKLEQHLYKNIDKIYKACYADYKKNEAEVDLAEIMPVVAEIKHTVRRLKKWMKPRKVKTTMTMMGTKGYVSCEPKGVVLIISPWNYPINLTLGPLVCALAAGNTVILKPSELTPNISAFLTTFIREIFTENHVAIFEGGIEVSKELLEFPFNHIFFTGSPSVGKVVMEAAAKNLTSVTLELGGKSPVIVDQNTNLEKAARSIAWGKCTNNGQTCIAPDYVFVHKNDKNKFIETLKKSILKFYGENEKEIATCGDYCRIVNQRHYQRVKGLIDESIANGAKVEFGNIDNQEDNLITPTILSNITPEHVVMQQEIFGPVLPIVEYEDITEVKEFINKNHKPLALYIFSNNKKNIQDIIKNTSAGGTVVNNTMIHYSHANLPFGGVNNSGVGNSHGEFGFKAFSHERAILYQSQLVNLSTLFLPPYTSTVKKIIKLTTKHLT